MLTIQRKTELKRNPAKVWKFLKLLGVGKSVHESFPKTANLNLLNQHLSASNQKRHTLKRLISAPSPDDSPLVFSKFSLVMCGKA